MPKNSSSVWDVEVFYTTWLLKLISFFEIVEQYGRDKFQSGYKPLNSNSLTGSPWKYNLHQK